MAVHYRLPAPVAGSLPDDVRVAQRLTENDNGLRKMRLDRDWTIPRLIEDDSFGGKRYKE